MRPVGDRDNYLFFDFVFFLETFRFTAFLWAFFAMFNSPSLRVASPSEYSLPRGRCSFSNNAGPL
jgi:hypothetical protein